MGRLFAAIIVVLAAAVVVANATAGKPETTRIEVDDTFADLFLSAECGVAVTTTVQGHVIIREFLDREKGTVALQTLSLRFTATAGDNRYRFHDVGSDHVKVKKDGSSTLMIVGQIPFDFTGVLKIDLLTGDVIHEPSHDISGRVDDACEALTA